MPIPTFRPAGKSNPGLAESAPRYYTDYRPSILYIRRETDWGSKNGLFDSFDDKTDLEEDSGITSFPGAG